MSAHDWLSSKQFDPTTFSGYDKSQYGFVPGRRDLANTSGQTEAADTKYGGDPIAETQVRPYVSKATKKFRPSPFDGGAN